MSKSNFDKVDAAAKRLHLSTQDTAVLLQVTPTMVSRYRKGGVSNVGRRDPGKFKRAAAALKYIRAHYDLKGCSPHERMAVVVEAMKSTGSGDELRLPVYA